MWFEVSGFVSRRVVVRSSKDVGIEFMGKGWPLFLGRESVLGHGQILWGLVVGMQVCLMMGGLRVEVHRENNF